MEEFYKLLSEEGKKEVKRAVEAYKLSGCCSIIPFTNLTFLVKSGIMTENGTNHEALESAIEFLNNN